MTLDGSIMLKISHADIMSRIYLDNPWWSEPQGTNHESSGYPHRAYFEHFYRLATQRDVRRAIIMMGPRRVGKTVMLYQLVQKLIREGKETRKILFVSIDTPVYVGMSLEQIFKTYLEIHGLSHQENLYVIFDEIQYLKDWEVHLKDLIDRYSSVKFIASGSAAAALRLKSHESGAGRFTDFMLPPLTFYEYLKFKKLDQELIKEDPDDYRKDDTHDIHALNSAFIDYLNYGGYPEVVMSQTIRSDMKRYVGQDIIDKVLLRDLPSLYGINDVQELNQLFTVLAYNTGNEVSLEELSQSSGVAKNTLKRYMEYLEAAFLIIRVSRVDEQGRHFKRQRTFKVYLTNPSMRAALFQPVKDGDQAIGALAETAIFSQWMHSEDMELLRYARWKKAEVDIVGLRRDTLKPRWAYEIKWSDRYVTHPHELKGLIQFGKLNDVASLGASTKSIKSESRINGLVIKHFPCSLHCWHISKSIVQEG